MKILFAISLATIFTTSCCLATYEPRFPVLMVELRDIDTGEDLFISGQLSVDSISLTNVENPDQHFSVRDESERTIIQFGPSQQAYTISVGKDVNFEVFAKQAAEEKRCYTSTTITNVSVTPYDFEAKGDEYLKDWTVIVWVN